MSAVTTPRRLRALGYDVTSDNGGGFEIWAGRVRVGRVFSRAALEAWTAPEENSMQVVMKYRGVPRRYHRTTKEGSVCCGLIPNENFWGTFEIPNELVRLIPACMSCQRIIEHDEKATDMNAVINAD